MRFCYRNVNKRQLRELEPVVQAVEAIGCTLLYLDGERGRFSGYFDVEGHRHSFDAVKASAARAWRETETPTELLERMQQMLASYVL